MAAATDPSVSIVIPTYNRPEHLAGCLEALAALDYPRRSLEVVVVDDGGTDPLEAVVERLGGRLEVQLLRVENGGPAAARNEGCRTASGDVFAFTDDDCRPDSAWLRRLLTRWDGTARHALGGRTVNSLVDNLFSATSQLIIDVGYAHKNADLEGAGFLITNNLLVPAEGFRAVGGFDPSFVTSEDRDFCDRWVVHGFSLGYVPEAIVYHEHDLTMKSFFRQQFAYGRGAARFHKAHARRWNRRVTIEPSFYAKLFLAPFKLLGGRRALQQALLLQFWNVANTAGFFYEHARAIGFEPTSDSRDFGDD
jgi:GT2 family glycosyltransferase